MYAPLSSVLHLLYKSFLIIDDIIKKGHHKRSKRVRINKKKNRTSVHCFFTSHIKVFCILQVKICIIKVLNNLVWVL